MTTTSEGAILKRDGRRYAVVTRIPAGIVNPSDLEKNARIGRMYHVPILNITSGQRIALVGLEPENVQKVIGYSTNCEPRHAFLLGEFIACR